jgi:hypothetical protein
MPFPTVFANRISIRNVSVLQYRDALDVVVFVVKGPAAEATDAPQP